MFVVSVTRLHLRSLRYVVQFALATWAVARQVRRSDGFVVGEVAARPPYDYWTITLWQSVEAMRRFRNGGAHAGAMPRLLDWCDETAFALWEQPGPELPTLDRAYEELRARGRLSKIRHPSAAHLAGRTVGDRKPQPGLKLIASRAIAARKRRNRS